MTRAAPNPTPSTTDIAAGPLTFRLRAWGPPEAPPLLLVGHVSDGIDGLAAALAETTPARRVLVPDGIDAGDGRARAIAGPLANLVEALGRGRLDVVGVGSGGTVAACLG
ncbi:MAG: hypothetical protein ACRD26_11595, partial [Vicinamibacterales bacterium]